jgi:hypothetical protein
MQSEETQTQEMRMQWQPTLIWERCKAGYALEQRRQSAEEKTESWRQDTALAEGSFLEEVVLERRPLVRPTYENWHFVALGQDREPVQLNEKDNAIVFDFVNAYRPQKGRKWKRLYIDFANRYGLPSSRHAGEIDLKLFELRAVAVKHGMDCIRRGGLSLLAECHPWKSRVSIDTQISEGSDKTLQFILKMRSLDDFIWALVYRLAEMEVKITECSVCSGLFLRKREKQWCSDACKQREYYNNRKGSCSD